MNETGTFETGYIEIDKRLLIEVEIEKFYSLFDKNEDEKALNTLDHYENKRELILDFYEKLYKNYPDLFKLRDYCIQDGPHGYFKRFSGICHFSSVRLEIRKNLSGKYFLMLGYDYNSPRSDYEDLKDYTKQFFDAYFIDQAYQRCKEDDRIKINSHREFRQFTHTYKLNDIISVDISTQFNFTSLSCFFVDLKYDGVKIIPYSRMVLYHDPNPMGLMKHTREFYGRDYSWKSIIDFIKDTCNDLLNYGSGWPNTNYITNEFEQIVKCLKIPEQSVPLFRGKAYQMLKDGFAIQI